MVYFDVRPSARYPTLEVRVCDAVPLLDDAVTLAGLARALVLTALRSADRSGPSFTPPRPELVRAGRLEKLVMGWWIKEADLPITLDDTVARSPASTA